MAKKKEGNQNPEKDQTTPAAKTGAARGRSKTEKTAAPRVEAGAEPETTRAPRKTKAPAGPAAETPVTSGAAAPEGLTAPVTAAPKKRGGSKKAADTPAAGASVHMGPPPSGVTPAAPVQSGAEAAAPKKRGGTRKAAAPVAEQTPPPAPKKTTRGKKATQQMTEPEANPVALPDTVEQQPETSSPKHVQHIGEVFHDLSRFTDFDVYLFREGKHFSLYDKLGSHVMTHNGRPGVYFAVWAPNAEEVSVVGDFNHWDRGSHHLRPRHDHSGIWEGFIPDVGVGMLYKYHIKSRYHLYHVEKTDPYAFTREVPPLTASIVSELHYDWEDQAWREQCKAKAGTPQPYSVYELHIGSWRIKPEDNGRPLTYRELAEVLPQYIKEMGFTHVEFMPVMFHPFNGSWGYQITGYFAPASQFGHPQDLMHLIDVLHREGIGVIMDWVPSHFPSDEHGLVYFDGTHLYEHADPRKGYHPDWNSYIFNYGRNEVRSFLISNAIFWLDKYHVDGLRVDAVASMLYLDYSRKEGEWIPNEYGGRENLEALSFLRDFNEAVKMRFPEVLTIAEESTAWPGVTAPVDQGGLGFDKKWMMGWMHDTLTYFSKDPIYRKYHQGDITFSAIYAFTERFMLPLSHDEVVHGKGSLLRKMPGDEWQQFANLRALYSYMYAHPGSKLLFMGAEIGQSSEWNHNSSVDWHLLQYGYHTGVQQLVARLNHLYREEPALYRYDHEWFGFEWVDFQDAHNSVISFLRKGEGPQEIILVVCNLTPAFHPNYRLGVPVEGHWAEIFNSDDTYFGGSGQRNPEGLYSSPEPYHGKDFSLDLVLPPLGVTYLKFYPPGS